MLQPDHRDRGRGTLLQPPTRLTPTVLLTSMPPSRLPATPGRHRRNHSRPTPRRPQPKPQQTTTTNEQHNQPPRQPGQQPTNLNTPDSPQTATHILTHPVANKPAHPQPTWRLTADCFGVEPGGKFFNGDRYQPNVRSSPAMLHDIIVNCSAVTRRGSGVVDALRSGPNRP